MMKIKLLTSYSVPADGIIAIVRIITGLLIMYWGFFIFNYVETQHYIDWLRSAGSPVPEFMIYLVRIIELICGLLIILGLVTRIAILPLLLTLVYSLWLTGIETVFNGQSSLSLLLVFVMLFAIGAGKFSLDYVLFDKKKIILKTDATGNLN
jgi:uncharacterized membrane protein YphA (DoxX/SURF4 family)